MNGARAESMSQWSLAGHEATVVATLAGVLERTGEALIASIVPKAANLTDACPRRAKSR
jgi:hypothetical protein